MQPLVLAAAVFVALCALFPLEPAVAQTFRYVDNIGSCDGLIPCYPTITAAVDAAAAGDTIEVFPGLYEEHVVVSGQSKDRLVLRAHDPALKPVVAGLSGNAVRIESAGRIQLLNFVIEAANAAGVTVVGGLSSDFAIQGNRIKSRFPVLIVATTGGFVTGNAFLGGGLVGDLNGAHIEANTFVDASISLNDITHPPSNNVIQHNVLRRGGISTGTGGRNTIASNFVSGNSGDGIAVGVGSVEDQGGNVIENNTSIENGGCDINDRSAGGNTWRANRFGTKCGVATE